MKQILLTTVCLLLTTCLQAQLAKPKQTFTKADSLRGSNNEYRNWWDVLHYDITVKPDFEKKEIEGVVLIKYNSLLPWNDTIFQFFDKIDSRMIDGVMRKQLNLKTLQKTEKIMQLDLQEGLIIDSIIMIDTTMRPFPVEEREKTKKVHRAKVVFEKKDGVYLLKFNEYGSIHKWDGYNLQICYHGKPREAKNAPWDGGWVWAKDKLGRAFVSVACQGLGASCWFPCKDYQGDEPDNGASVTVVVPDS